LKVEKLVNASRNRAYFASPEAVPQMHPNACGMISWALSAMLRRAEALAQLRFLSMGMSAHMTPQGKDCS